MASVQSLTGRFRKSIAGKPPPTVVRGAVRLECMGMIGVLETTLIVPTRSDGHDQG